MKTFEEFLDEYDKRTKRAENNTIDRVLYLLFRHFQKEIGEMLFEDHRYFMKAFRQIDVLPTGYADQAIWDLLDGAKIFWEMYHEIFIKDKTEEE